MSFPTTPLFHQSSSSILVAIEVDDIIWPIPSTTGNTLTFNYKFRVPDLSIADYTTPGTVAVANGSTAVVGTQQQWQVTTDPQLDRVGYRLLRTLLRQTLVMVCGIKYKVWDRATSLTLYQPYQGTSVTASPAGTGYIIGQMPLVAEDFQDMLVWKVLQYYFTSIVDNPKKFNEYKISTMKSCDYWLIIRGLIR